MRIRVFTEIEITDTAVLTFKENVRQHAPQRLNEPMEILVADSLTRRLEEVIKAFQGVSEVRSVLIPTLLGL